MRAQGGACVAWTVSGVTTPIENKLERITNDTVSGILLITLQLLGVNSLFGCIQV